MEPTKILASFCAKTEHEDLPPDVVSIAKHTILDTLGSAIGTHADEPEKPEVNQKSSTRLSRTSKHRRKRPSSAESSRLRLLLLPSPTG